MVDAELIEGLKGVLAGGPPMRLALVFGSVARGTSKPHSDLDIAIFPVDPDLPLREELNLQSRLSAVSGREVDLVRVDQCAPGLRFRLAREGLLLLGSSSELARFQARAGIEHADLAPARRRAEQLYLRRLAAGGARGGP
jgi:uncharacterized protein